MSMLDFDQQEFLDSIKMVEENEGLDFLKEAMTRTFQAVMFLGNNINNQEAGIKELAIFNIRLCYVYFLLQEDFITVQKIKDLSSLIESPNPNIVDTSVIEKICINPN